VSLFRQNATQVKEEGAVEFPSSSASPRCRWGPEAARSARELLDLNALLVEAD